MTTKASPVVATPVFSTSAYYDLMAKSDDTTAEMIRAIHAAIKPGVTQAAIADLIVAHMPVKLAATTDAKKIRMDVSHYAQTATLSLSNPALRRSLYNSNSALVALYKKRTTGSKASREEMVANYGGSAKSGDFAAYVQAWSVGIAKAALEAANATRELNKQAPAPKPSTKDGTPDASTNTPSASVIPSALSTFPGVLAELSRFLTAASPEARAKMITAAFKVLDKTYSTESDNWQPEETPTELVAA